MCRRLRTRIRVSDQWRYGTVLGNTRGEQRIEELCRLVSEIFQMYGGEQRRIGTEGQETTK